MAEEDIAEKESPTKSIPAAGSPEDSKQQLYVRYTPSPERYDMSAAKQILEITKEIERLDAVVKEESQLSSYSQSRGRSPTVVKMESSPAAEKRTKSPRVVQESLTASTRAGYATSARSPGPRATSVERVRPASALGSHSLRSKSPAKPRPSAGPVRRSGTVSPKERTMRANSRGRLPSPARSVVSGPDKRQLALDSQAFSSAAKAKTELLSLQKSYSVLEKKSRSTEARVEELHAENLDLKGALDHRLRELEFSRRAADKYQESSRDLESQLKESQDYVRRLESKLAVGAKGLGLATKNTQLVDKSKNMAKELKTQKELNEAQHILIEKLKKEVIRLRDALEQRAEEYGENGKETVGLMVQVAQLKDENIELALELSKKATWAKEREAEAASLRSKLDELNFIRENNNDELLEFERQIQDLTSENTSLKIDSDAMAEKVTLLEGEVRHREKERDHMKQNALELLQFEESCKDLQTENIHLREEVSALNEQMKENAARNAKQEQIMTKEKEVIDKLRGDLNIAQAENDSLRKDIDNLHAEMESHSGLTNEMADRLKVAEEQKKRAEQNHDLIDQSMKMLKVDLEAAFDKFGSEEANYRKKIENLVNELKMVMEERDHLKMNSNESESRCSAATTKMQQVERERDALKEQLEGISKSKSMLQQNLMNNLAAVRQQAAQAQKEKRDAVEALRMEQLRFQGLRERRDIERKQKNEMQSMLRKQQLEVQLKKLASGEGSGREEVLDWSEFEDPTDVLLGRKSGKKDADEEY